MDDRRIIDLFFARNEDAINLTKEKYGRYLNSIAYDILGDRHDAAECESDTYLRAWNSIPPTDPRSLPAYLAKIVRNIALNRIRTDTRRIPIKMSLILDELSEVIPDVEGDIAERLGLRECIVGYVNGLEQERRNVFLKRYFYLMSVNDIASDMGMRVGTVKSILFRMREELRSYLNERGIEI
jgi:RNA polymerase sigma-70 factor (ECF subfamily)